MALLIAQVKWDKEGEEGTVTDTKWKSPGVLCAALHTQHPPAVGRAILI